MTMIWRKLCEWGHTIYAWLFCTHIYRMVYAFHVRAGQLINTKPTTDVPEKIARLRAKLILEEAFEVARAIYGDHPTLLILQTEALALTDRAPVELNLPQLVKELGDVDYVIEGTRISYGVNGLPIAQAIQKSNMAKFGPGSWVREDGKQMKPPDWQPPDIEAELKKQGWVPAGDLHLHKF